MKKHTPEVTKARMKERRDRLKDLFFEISGKPDETGQIKPQAKSWKWKPLFIEAKKLEICSVDSSFDTMLKDLVKMGIICQKGKYYMPTEMGIGIARKDIWDLVNRLGEYKINKGLYWHGVDSLGLFDFGFSGHTASDKNIPNDTNYKNFLFNLTKKVEYQTFELIVDSLKNNKIALNELQESGAILAVELDWNKFARAIRQTQSFIEDINSNKDIFSDSRQDFNKLEDKLTYLLFLTRFSLIFGNDNFKKRLRTFIKEFSQSYKFYEITMVNPKLFEEFINYIKRGKNPLNYEHMLKVLLPQKEIATKTGDMVVTGYVDIADTYIKAARLCKYEDPEFITNLKKFEVAKNKRHEKLIDDLYK